MVNSKSMAVLAELTELTVSTENWKQYRNILKQSDPPILPYIGIIFYYYLFIIIYYLLINQIKIKILLI